MQLTSCSEQRTHLLSQTSAYTTLCWIDSQLQKSFLWRTASVTMDLYFKTEATLSHTRSDYQDSLWSPISSATTNNPLPLFQKTTLEPHAPHTSPKSLVPHLSIPWTLSPVTIIVFCNKVLLNLRTGFQAYHWQYELAKKCRMHPADPAQAAISKQDSVLGAHQQSIQFLMTQVKVISDGQEKILTS